MSSAECPNQAGPKVLERRTPRSKINALAEIPRTVTKSSFELFTCTCTHAATGLPSQSILDRCAAWLLPAAASPQHTLTKNLCANLIHLSHSVPYRSPNTSHPQAASTHKKQEAPRRRPSRIALARRRCVLGAAVGRRRERPPSAHHTTHTRSSSRSGHYHTRIPNAVNARAARALPHARPRAGRAASPPPLALALVALRRRGAAPAPAEPGPAGQVRPALDVEPSGALALCVVGRVDDRLSRAGQARPELPSDPPGRVDRAVVIVDPTAQSIAH